MRKRPLSYVSSTIEVPMLNLLKPQKYEAKIFKKHHAFSFYDS